MGVVTYVTLLTCFWIMAPWSLPTVTAPAFAVGFNVPQVVGALVNIAVLIVPMWAVKKGTPEALSMGSSWLFSWFLFVTLLRLVLLPVGSTAFVFPLMVTLIMAVVHIEQHYIVRKARKAAVE